MTGRMKFEIKRITVALLFLIAVPLATVFIAPHKAFAVIAVPQTVGHISCLALTASCSGSFGTLPSAGDTIVVTIAFNSFSGFTISPTDVFDNQGHSSYILATTSSSNGGSGSSIA
jgi:hypothetical protein